MEEKEQGLTLEERLMFIILGIILLTALGVLAFNSLSNHERKAEGTNTKEVDNNEQPVEPKKEENKEENKSNDSKVITLDEIRNNIIRYNEFTSKKSKKTPTKKVLSNTKKTVTTNTKKTVTTNTKKTVTDNEGTGSTDQGEVDSEAAIYEDPEQMDWTFNKNIVKEAYADETVKIDNTVTLSNDTKKEAVVIIKDKDGKEIPYENNEVKLPAGEYTYVYTCNGKTKEIPLVVYNRLENVKISIANVKGTSNSYNEDIAFIIKESSITNEKNNYNLKVKRQNNYNIVPLKVELEKAYNKIESTTKGFTVSNDQTITDLNNNEFIILLDLNNISLTKENKVFLTIDGIEYLFNFNISIENVKPKEEQKEEEPTDPNKEVISNEEDNKNDSKEEDEEPVGPKPEPPKEETPAVEEKPVAADKPLPEEVQETVPTSPVEETETA